MPDFTSALYLGLAHPARALPVWSRLTLGRPAVLEEPPGAATVAAALARLQGVGQALLLPSTLHLFFDLFRFLAGVGGAGQGRGWGSGWGRLGGPICVDAGAYPIARWGAAGAAGCGVPVQTFRHHDPAALARLLDRRARRSVPPVVLADGLCPTCGRVAPLADYLALVRRHGGLLVVDDTQALGVLGTGPTTAMPYGRGGGGVARYLGLSGLGLSGPDPLIPDLLIGASLAKGFGVPVAALSGSPALVAAFAAQSDTRLHCSPPSAAVIAAAARALALNRQHGDALRWRLWSRVRRLRDGLARLGLAADGGAFPVQTLRPVPGLPASALHRQLRARGVRVLPLRRRGEAEPRLGLLLTAAHRDDEIDACLRALAAALPERAERTERLGRRAATGLQRQPCGGEPCPHC